jgi:hypothetical protein
VSRSTSQRVSELWLEATIQPVRGVCDSGEDIGHGTAASFIIGGGLGMVCRLSQKLTCLSDSVSVGADQPSG